MINRDLSFILLCCYFLLIPLVTQAQQEEFSVPGQNLFVNKIAAQQAYDPDLNGSGITVSIKEFSFDSTDVDFRGRIVATPNAASIQSTHASIVASLVGGAGNADLRGRGAAPGCKLVSSSFIGLEPDPDYLTPNITVQNHSYGVDIQNWYGAGAIAYDQTTGDNPLLLHIFSAGNKGDSSSVSGTYPNLPGFANLSGNFKMAKNVLLVGSVDSFGQVAPLSSRGPAYDGRIKPDLVAFGYDGTSGAAALVSGAAAVIQQSLFEFSNDLPYSNLVRAILINSADDIAPEGPDFESGFGNLNLKKAVQLSTDKQYRLESISAGQTVFLPISMPAKLRQFKITLAWNDPTAPLFAPKALLNDLDLSLIDPLGNEHLPWVLNTFPNQDSLGQAAHRGRDTLNNIEQLCLNNPMPGLWQIRVAAPPLLGGSQDFALAWSKDTLAHFEWNYPSLNAPAPAGKEVILRWEHNFPDSFARLEWRSLPSPEWQLIEDAAKLQMGWQRWILPDTFTKAQLRMLVGGHEFRSDVFLISNTIRVQVGFNCADSVALFWNAVSPDAQYQLLGLGEQYLEPIDTLNDTFVVLKKSEFPQQRFAVAPLADGNAIGQRSPAPDISTQGVHCYFKSFLADLNDDKAVDLKLQIGTSYGVSKVFFEKLMDGAFLVINEQFAGNTAFQFVDESPERSVNTYRASLLMANGARLPSDTVTVYYPGAKGWFVYPNPAPSQGFLQIVSTTDELARFTLYDVWGKQLLQTIADDLRVEIPLEGIPRGVYFYKVDAGNIWLGSGKLVVE